MPNIGRPSQGCDRCRQRKVKCDQRKPGCLRCENFKQDCPGYTQPEKWLFVGQKAQYLRPQHGRIQSSDVSSHNTLAELQLNVPPDLPADLGSGARSFFIRSFVLNDNSSKDLPGHLEFLPRLFLGVSDDSCLKHALTAVALVNLANHHQSQSATWELQIAQAHNKALRSINEQLAGSKAYLDETLASVHLMAMFEILAPSFTFTTWKAHVHGALELLRGRGLSQVETSTGCQLFHLILQPLVMKIVSTAQLPPMESLDMIRHLQFKMLHDATDKLQALTAGFFFEIGIYAAETRIMVLNPMTLTVAKLVSWISRGQSLEFIAEQSIVALVPDTNEWQPVKEKDTERFSFSSAFVMAQWIRYWAAQLTLDNVLFKLSARVVGMIQNSGQKPQISLPSLLSIKSRAQDAAEKIINCISFALDRKSPKANKSIGSTPQGEWPITIGGLTINYALEMILEFDITSKEHKSLAREALERIGLECGIARNGRLTAISPASGSPSNTSDQSLEAPDRATNICSIGNNSRYTFLAYGSEFTSSTWYTPTTD